MPAARERSRSPPRARSKSPVRARKQAGGKQGLISTLDDIVRRNDVNALCAFAKSHPELLTKPVKFPQRAGNTVVLAIAVEYES